MPHLLCHEASVFVISPRGPRFEVILYNNPGVLRTCYNPNLYTIFCKFFIDKLRQGARDCVDCCYRSANLSNYERIARCLLSIYLHIYPITLTARENNALQMVVRMLDIDVHSICIKKNKSLRDLLNKSHLGKFLRLLYMKSIMHRNLNRTLSSIYEMHKFKFPFQKEIFTTINKVIFNALSIETEHIRM